MTQSKSDVDFLNGLHLMIDSIESSYFAKDDDAEDDLPEADHWCPDVQAWHTSEHEAAKAPSVHVNVDSENGDDPYQSENNDVEKGILGAAAKGAGKALAAGAAEGIGQAVGSKIGNYDQNTNLERRSQENSESSIAEPFLNRYDTPEEETADDEEENNVEKSNDFVKSLVQTHAKSIDLLKIWGSVDRVMPKSDTNGLVDDISILKSFDLDDTTNVEDLVGGTLVHKMLTDRSSRPTFEWWDSSMRIAKSIEAIEEPGFFSAFLYYEPDGFDLGDFVNIEKAENAVAQDLEMMPNSSGGDAIDGLGLSADKHHGPNDEDCD